VWYNENNNMGKSEKGESGEGFVKIFEIFLFPVALFDFIFGS
jgi:hypothetical protein